MTLATLRTQLAEAKNALRDDKATLDTVQAIAEFNALLTGKNAEERKQQLAYQLAMHSQYQGALRRVRDSQNDVELLQAQVSAAEDEASAARIAAMNRLADALAALAQRKPVDSVIVETALPDDWYRK